MFLLRYWKQIAGVVIVLALVAALWGHGYYTKGLACEAAMLGLENAQLEAQRKETEYWQRKAYEADEALAKALSRKPAAPAVREVVDANPSGCVLPRPVGDRLRDQIERANKAAAAR